MNIKKQKVNDIMLIADISIYRRHFELPIYRIRYIDAACGVDISSDFFLAISTIFELLIYRYLKSIADTHPYKVPFRNRINPGP